MNCPNCKSVEVRKHGFYRGKQRYQCKACARQFVEVHSQNLHYAASTGVQDGIYQYIRSTSTAPQDLLVDLHREMAEYSLARMQPTLAQTQLICLLMKSMGVRRVLEVGIFSGYATLAMALVLPDDGQLISCGVDGDHLEPARSYWRKAGVIQKIDLQICSGIDLLDRLLIAPIELFDSIVICGHKHQYPLYYHRAIDLLRPQGLLFTTDVLWQGRVVNLASYPDEFTIGIDRFNRELATDNRVEVSIIPIGDGISIARKL